MPVNTRYINTKDTALSSVSWRVGGGGLEGDYIRDFNISMEGTVATSGGREAVPHGDAGSEEGVLAVGGPARCLALADHHLRLDKNVSSLVCCRRKPPQASRAALWS